MKNFIILILSTLIVSFTAWSIGFYTTSFWQTASVTGVPLLAFSNLPADNSFTATLNVGVGGANVVNYRYKLGPAATTDCSDPTGYSVSPISIGLSITDDMSNLTADLYRLCGIGINSLNVEQSFASATAYTWNHKPPVIAVIVAGYSDPMTTDVASYVIGGTDITDFRYKVGPEATIDCTNSVNYEPFDFVGALDVDLSYFNDGDIEFCLIGRNTANDVQSFANATSYVFTKNAPVMFNFLTSAQIVNESSGIMSVQVTLRRTRLVDVNLSIGFVGTAREGVNFSIPNKTVVIPAGNLTANFDVDILGSIPDGEDRILQIYADHFVQSESYPGEFWTTNIMIRDTTLPRNAVTELSMKYYHACLVRANGTLACWGENIYGQLGDSTQMNRSLPVNVSGTNWMNVSVGSIHTCAVTTSNAAYCWGYNNNGQLGIGTSGFTSYTTPQLVTGGHLFTKIASGRNSNCGLTTSKKIYCWGYNTDGNLGDNTTTQRTSPTSIARNDLDWADVVGGVNEFCAIQDVTGNLYCWGRNEDNQVNNTLAIVTSPYQMDNDSYVRVGMGEFTGCAINTADELKCWGFNYAYEAPIPDPFWSEVPTLSDVGQLYKDVAIGNDTTNYMPHGCGVTLTDQLRCWGSDASESGGPLGRRPLIGYEYIEPQNVDLGSSYEQINVALTSNCGILTNGELRCSGATGAASVPSPFTGVIQTPRDTIPEFNVKQISMGYNSGCRIDTNDKLWCYGTGREGAVYLDRQWMKILPQTNFKKVLKGDGIGSFGYTCAQDSTDQLWCWNYYDGVQDVVDPTLITGLTIKDFAVAGDSLCVIDTTDKILCRGGNNFGTLGNGTSGFGNENYTFNEILGGRTYKAISGDYGQVCAIDSNDLIYCWGTNRTQGTGSTTMTATPTQVNDASTYSKISSRDVHCGITISGTLKCWGRNDEGQVGNSRPSGGATVLSPAAVTSALSFTYVSAGTYQNACAIDTSSKLHCWGTNRSSFMSGDNRLGTGSFANYITVPTAVDAATNYAAVEMSHNTHSQCAITTGQKLRCWGHFSDSSYSYSYPSSLGFDHGIPYTVPGVTGN